MPRNPSAITDSLSVDPPLNQNANYRFNSDDRQYLDNQIRGIEQHLVDALIRGHLATYYRAAMDLAEGSAVCSASLAGLEEQVTLATAEALGTAQASVGVVLRRAPQGAYVLVCTGGSLPPDLTGLPVDSPGFVRINTTNGELERVSGLTVGDYAIGVLNSVGWMQVIPGLGVAATGGGGSPTGGAGGDLSGTYPNPTVAKVRGMAIGSAAGAIPTGAVLRATGPSSANWGAVDLADTDAVTGTLPRANQQAQNMAGDVTGTTAASTVAKINGIALSGTPTSGQVLTATGSAAANWQTPASGGGGEANTASSLGGTSLVGTKSGVDLRFKGLNAGSNVTFDTTNPNYITVNASDTGEANTASNLGGGQGIFTTKSGVNLPFKSLRPILPLDINPTSTELAFSIGNLTTYGSAFQVMRMNSGATAMEWAAMPSSSGSSGQANFANGSGGWTTWTGVTGGSYYIAFTDAGGGAVASNGVVRLANNLGNIIVQKDATSGDRVLLAANATDVFLGNPITGHVGQVANSWIYAATKIGFGVGTTLAIQIDANSVSVDRPRLGLASPYSSDGGVDISITGPSYTLPISEYSRSFIEIFASGSTGASPTAVFPNPASSDECYFKWVAVDGNTIESVTFSVGTGSTRTVDQGHTALLFFIPGGVLKLYDIATSST